MNLSSFLSNSLKILNVTKKAIPLIKDLNPSINTIKNKLTELNKKDVTELKYEKKEVKNNNNSLTFFK